MGTCRVSEMGAELRQVEANRGALGGSLQTTLIFKPQLMIHNAKIIISLNYIQFKRQGRIYL